MSTPITTKATGQNWLGDGGEIPDTSARRIFAAAESILKAGRPGEGEAPTPEPDERIVRAIDQTTHALSHVAGDYPLDCETLDDISRGLCIAAKDARAAGADDAARLIGSADDDLCEGYHIDAHSRAEIAGNLREALGLLRRTN